MTRSKSDDMLGWTFINRVFQLLVGNLPAPALLFDTFLAERDSTPGTKQRTKNMNERLRGVALVNYD